MNTRLIIDKAGRVVIPKPLREKLHLEPGDSLEMESAGGADHPAPGSGDGSARQGAWRLGIS
jgi:AbrB family looped-hinge helix DNA binding protein